MENFWDLVGEIGGIGALLTGIVVFFSNLLANKKIEEYKAASSEKLENLRHQLAVSNSRLSRYYEKQFETYNAIWENLQSVKNKADSLWLLATEEGLEEFVDSLIGTKAFIANKSLFLEEKQYKELNTLLEKLSRYDDGKFQLLNIRKMKRPNDVKIDSIIEKNQVLVEEYTRLIEKIRKNFRKQLKI